MRSSHVLKGLLAFVLLLAVAVPAAMAQAGYARGRMSGRVVDDGGEPLAGVAIAAESPERPSLETTTDDNGRFSLIGFTTGMWTVSAEIEGYEVAPGTLRVTQQGVATANFSMLRVRSGFELLVGAEALEGLDSDALEADLNASNTALEAQDFDTAIAGYEQLLTVLPNLSYLHLNIGNAHRGKGDYEMALASYEKLLEDPERKEQAEIEISRTRLAMGDLDAAAGLVFAGANASREDLYNLGEVDFARGDVDAAAGWYEKAAATDPSWEKPWFKLALVALNKGDVETAKQNFQKVVDMAPDSEDGAQAQATLSALP
jgi:tetratricopeptide (TPR) repeat protein